MKDEGSRSGKPAFVKKHSSERDGRRITAEAATGSPPPRHLDVHDDHFEDLKALLEERTSALIETFDALKACGEEYAEVLDDMPLAFLSLDENLLMLACNRTAEQLLGTTREELLGKNLWSSYHDEQAEAAFKKKYAEALSKKEPVVFQAFSTLARKWLDVHVHPSDSRGLLVYLRDITKEKKYLEISARLWKDYRSLADNAPDLILRFNEALQCTFANREFERLIGIDPNKLIGKSHQQLGLPPETADRLDAAMREVFSTRNVVSTNLEIATRNGRKYFSWRAAPEMDVSKRVMSILVIATDITRQREEEETRRKLEEQLRESQRLEAVGTLSGGIAHDFNNLLAIIIGNTELALDGMAEDSPASHQLKRIFTAALRGRDLVKQILAFSRKSAQHVKSFSLTPLIKETVKLLRSTISTTIEIRLDLEAEDDTVTADPTQIQQVLLNLTTNAAQAMAGEGVMTIALSEITLDTQNLLPAPYLNPGDYAVLSVADTGEGMDEAVKQKIFEPFFTTKGLGKGSGLGLSVVYGIVKAHGGAITVASAKGKGSTFRVFLPKGKGRAHGADTIEAAPLPSGRGTILAVDDEEPIATMVQESLSRLGYEVYTETDPQKALELFSINPSRFDLVITDQAMPRMSGLTLARRLLAVRPDVPILLCTGYSETVDEKTAKDAGIKGFLMKPLTREQLAVMVKETLAEPGKE